MRNGVFTVISVNKSVTVINYCSPLMWTLRALRKENNTWAASQQATATPYSESQGSSVQFSSVAQPCLTLWDPKCCSKPGFPVHHQLPELAQTHVHQMGDSIQPSHPLSSLSPPAFNLSQHQGLSQWVSSSNQVAKVWSFSFSISPSKEAQDIKCAGYWPQDSWDAYERNDFSEPRLLHLPIHMLSCFRPFWLFGTLH